jgi:UDP-2,3-diacylglucosamine hydrolase
MWILADPHGGHSDEADRALIELLDRALAARVDFFVLGDLFTGWLAPERFLGELERAVVDRFRAMRRHGARVEMVVGNRDYLVKETLLGDAFDRVHDEASVVDIGGKPTLVVHGDRVNAEDRMYQAWYRLSRSAPVTKILSALPAAAGRRLVHGTEAKLSGTNQAYKTGTLPIAALEELGREALRRGAARALVGHFHHDRVLDVNGGVPVVLAPGWFVDRRILVAEDDGVLSSVDPTLVR